MKRHSLIILVCCLMQLTGCALLSMNREQDADLDPVTTVARKYRATDNDPADLSEPGRNPQSIRQNDAVVLGMPMNDVLAIMGEPSEVETAGIFGSGYEKWTYYTGLSKRMGLGDARLIYFEKGLVAGWDTVRN